MIPIIICIVIILLLCYILFFRTRREAFGDPVLVKTTPDIIDLKQQFDDLIVYDNDPDGRLGYDKCIEKCNGYCVEHGQTGSAYCYPVHEPVEKDFYGMIIPNEQKLTFPNVE